jgi:short-subunit dehydrogenase
MQKSALIIGNTDGIGLGTTERLLSKGWTVYGLSRRNASISKPEYHHRTLDVCDQDYVQHLSHLAQTVPIDLCLYCVGIGEILDLTNMKKDAEIFEVNLTGLVKTVSAIAPEMIKRRSGHIMGLSSLADELLSAEAPSYNASKAGFSNYLGGLQLALKPKGIYVSNVRFGFVNTKMAKGDLKPFMMSVETAVDHIETCIQKKPARYTAPWQAIPIVKLYKLIMKFTA